MSKFVVMPKEHYQAALDALRTKKKVSDLFKSDELAQAIENIPVGGSPNSRSWTESSGDFDGCACAEYADNIWVACANRKGLCYSYDGKTWTQSNITSGSFTCVHNSEGLWVASSNYLEETYYSTDGKLWVQCATVGFRSLRCYRGMWIGVGDTGGYYSSNGYVWIASEDSFRYLQYVSPVKGGWVACLSDILVTGGILFSTTGIQWYSTNVTSGSFYEVHCVGDMCVAAGSSGVWYSTDGQTWIQSNLRLPASSVFYGHGIWVACTDAYGLWYSTNGKDWSMGDAPYSGFRCVHYAQGMWVAAANSGLCYSTDGINWAVCDVRSTLFWTLNQANGIWLASPYEGDMCYSYTWEPIV